MQKNRSCMVIIAGLMLFSFFFSCSTKEKQNSVDLKTGELVYFGSYEQDNNMQNGKEAVSWRVLSIEGGRALLISEYILDVKSYHDVNSDVTWETSYIRQWLNDDFYNESFSKSEKAVIYKATIENHDNTSLGTAGGNKTQDYVFFLCLEEADRYFGNDRARSAKNTAYSIANGAIVLPGAEDTGVWWLRSPGLKSLSNRYAACVVNDGRIVGEGNVTTRDWVGFRPALWVKLDSFEVRRIKTTTETIGSTQETRLQTTTTKKTETQATSATTSQKQEQVALKDTGNLRSYRNQIDEILQFEVTGKSNDTRIFGTDVYSDHSPLSIAAVHAGLLKEGETKVLDVKILGPQEVFRGSRRNGITSYSFGNWDGSYEFAGAQRLPVDDVGLMPGDRVYLGTYEQDNDLNNGKEKIAWIVLEVDDVQVLLISEFGLDVRQFDPEKGSITWEESTLRHWLNSDFYDEAFSEKEKNMILESSLKNDDNPSYGTPGGEDTLDMVFLLSIDEANRYFKESRSRRARPSAFAQAQGAAMSMTWRTFWWLRSPGNYLIDAAVAVVSDLGSVNVVGYNAYSENIVVRPAIRINADAYKGQIDLARDGYFSYLHTASEVNWQNYPVENTEILPADASQIFLTGTLKNAPQATRIKVEWYFIDEDPNNVLVEFTIDIRNVETDFFFTMYAPESGFSSGNYKAVLYINSIDAGTVYFVVE